jgi:ABC-2 type transport system permease protein
MDLLLFWKFIKVKIKIQIEYRGAFLLGVWGQISAYAAEYLVVWLFLQKFQTLNGWTWTEVVFMYSLNLLTYAIGASFMFSLTRLDRMVMTGDFDTYLTKPINPLFYYTANQFSVGYVAHILISMGMLLWSIQHVNIGWSLQSVLLLILFLISGTLLQAAAFLIVGSIVFLITNTQFLFSFFFSIRQFISYPLSLYEKIIQVVFTIIFPLAFVNYYPATILLSKHDHMFTSWIGLLTPFVSIIFCGIAYTLWRYGLNKYESAGG